MLQEFVVASASVQRRLPRHMTKFRKKRKRLLTFMIIHAFLPNTIDKSPNIFQKFLCNITIISAEMGKKMRKKRATFAAKRFIKMLAKIVKLWYDSNCCWSGKRHNKP